MMEELEAGEDPVDADGETEWPDHWDKRDQVRAVAEMLTEPRDAGWVADEAGVVKKTARKHLNVLVDEGELETRIGEDGTKYYYPDPTTQVFDQIRELSALSDRELTDELERIAGEIDEWQRSYDVETPNELRASIDETMTPAEREKRRELAYDWEQNQQARTFVRIALQTSDDIEALVDAYRPPEPVTE